MGKINFIKITCVLIIAGMYSCLQIPDPRQESLNSDPHHISVEQAVETMNSVIGLLYGGGTRSGGKNYTIQTLKGRHLMPIGTRSDGIAFPEDVLYIVNFENDEGFAILAADDRYDPIICITESGNLDIEDLLQLPDSDADYAELAELINNYVVYKSENLYDTTYMHRVIGRVDSVKVVGPLMGYNRWHQESPFNGLCTLRYVTTGEPIIGLDGNMIINKAGCGVIAAAQMIASRNYPTPSHFGAPNVTWQELLSYDFSKKIISRQPEVRQRDSLMRASIAKVIYEIADCIGVTYTNYGTPGAVPPDSVYNYFRSIYPSTDLIQPMTYNDGYNSNDVFWAINHNSPVYVEGYGTDTNTGIQVGHAWVIDGYMEFWGRLISLIRPGGYHPGQVHYELFHCRWGWKGGKANGYYLSHAFTPCNSPILMDETDGYGESGFGGLTNPYRFDLMSKMIYFGGYENDGDTTIVWAPHVIY